MKEKTLKTPLSIYFDLTTGKSSDVSSIKRMLSDMEGMYFNSQALEEQLKIKDVVVYEFYNLNIPKTPKHLSYGTTILYPGTIGDEYYMTKGHFHQILDTSEVYYCIRGNGLLLMENPEGDVIFKKMYPGTSVYVPPRYAHRSINISDSEPFISFYTYRADAGHDYKTIETKGFRKLVIKKDNEPQLIDNPKWID